VANSSCKNAFRLASLAVGSIVMNIQIDANMLTDANAAKDSIYQQLTAQGIDGAHVISATITITQNTSQSQNTVSPPSSSISPQTDPSTSASKMPLILGISIGAGVLSTDLYI